MKVVLLLFLSGYVAYAQKDCQPITPPKCDEKDLSCYGGVDPDGCPMPDFCSPSIQVPGKDGNFCPAFCPTKCSSVDEMSCYGGEDGNWCQMPDFCHPSKGNPGFDGNECPSFCPVKCSPDEISCYGGSDPNGCMMGDFCWPMKGQPGKDGNECPVSCPIKCDGDDLHCPAVDMIGMAVKSQDIVFQW